MYNDYWKLKEAPFSNALDLRFMYMTPQHSEGVARLLYAVKQRKEGAVLTGDFGCGKSLVRMLFLSKLESRGNFAIALVDNPLDTPVHILQDIYCQISQQSLSAEPRQVGYRELTEALKARHANGFQNLVIVEEAQLVNQIEILEQLRLLMNLLDDQGRPLLTMILIGQQEFLQMFEQSPGLVQRITARWHLTPLSREQTRDYVDHRLRVAGANGWIFDDSAVDALYKHSGGIARVINNTSDMALYLGMRERGSHINAETVERVTADLNQNLSARHKEEAV